MTLANLRHPFDGQKPRIKQRTCKNKACADRFTPTKPLQSACCIGCAIIIGRDKIKADADRVAKLERKELAARKEKRKTPSERAEPAQAAINRYVNFRDRGKPCISCGKPDRGVRNASHYKSRGSNSALRFHLWNIYSSCYKCNKELSGNIAGYIVGLNDRHPGRIEFLNNHPRSREYSPEYLKRIARIFNKKALRAEKRIQRAAA